MPGQIVLVRHGETEWSATGRHTGRTDISLTMAGREQARRVGPTLEQWEFAHRFSSPLKRARETCELSGIEGPVTFLDDLMEWDYGVAEGLTNAEMHAQDPTWSKWFNPGALGESAADVGARADEAIVRLTQASEDGPVVAFAHGHLLAILIARWIGLDATEARRFVLDTATVSVLGIKRTDRVLRMMNHACDGPISAS